MADFEKIKEEPKIDKNYNHYITYFAIFIGISIFSMYVIYKKVGDMSNFMIIKSFPFRIILSILLLLIIYFLLDGLRLFYVLKTVKADIKFRHIIKLIFINLFVSNITPFATGGGVAQIYYLSKKGVPVGKASAATTIRTVLAALFFFIITPIIILTEKNLTEMLPEKTVFIYIAIFTSFYLFLMYIAIFNNKLIKRVVYNIIKFLNSKEIINKKKKKKLLKNLFSVINMFGKSMAIFFKGDLKNILISVALTILFLLAQFMFSVLLIKGMGYNNVSSFSIILIQIVIVFFMYFAPTPGASGVAEGSYSLLFSRFIDKSDILPLIFTWRFLTKYLGMIIGMIIFFYYIKERKIKND